MSDNSPFSLDNIHPAANFSTRDELIDSYHYYDLYRIRGVRGESPNLLALDGPVRDVYRVLDVRSRHNALLEPRRTATVSCNIFGDLFMVETFGTVDSPLSGVDPVEFAVAVNAALRFSRFSRSGSVEHRFNHGIVSTDLSIADWTDYVPLIERDYHDITPEALVDMPVGTGVIIPDSSYVNAPGKLTILAAPVRTYVTSIGEPRTNFVLPVRPVDRPASTPLLYTANANTRLRVAR